MSKSLIITLMLLLSGCSVKPTEKVNYYLLNSVPAESHNIARKTGEHVIAVAEIRLADYLKQTNLTMQLQTHQLYFSKNHFWAESLQTGIQKALISDLNAGTDSASFVDASSEAAIRPTSKINISVDHFVTTHDSKVVMSGQFWFKQSGANNTSQLQHFHYTADLQQDGFPHAVFKLRELLKRLSDDILVKANQLGNS